MPTYDEIVKGIESRRPDLLNKNAKYQPKLTFAARCSALAAMRAGYKVPVIAVAFGVNRSTLRYIANPASPHYKDVRKELRDLGLERFIEQYLTPDVTEMIEKAAGDPEVEMSGEEIRDRRAVDTTQPNKKATSRAGRHAVLYGDGTIHVEVKWFDEVPDDPGAYPPQREPGWYVWIDPSSPAYEIGNWAAGVNPPTPSSERFTSKTALDSLLSAIGGELIEK